MRPLLHLALGALVALSATACRARPEAGGSSSSPSASARPTASSLSSVSTPDLIGLASVPAARRIGRLDAAAGWDVSLSWRSVAITRCGIRPGTVVRQRPAPGASLRRGSMISVWTATMDLARFRGPCAPSDPEGGWPKGPDASLAQAFYRFAADPSRPAPFVNGAVWTGIERGSAATWVQPGDLDRLAAWQLHTSYAEATGPFSALDVLARSGGYYELSRGIVPTCPAGDRQAPSALAGLRAISLTPPRDTIASCSQWWGVTLFLDDADLIRGVALRLGSP